MAETHRPPEQFKLRVRRFDPESGEAPYWDEHTIELEPHRSVLEGILQAKARFDGSIGIRCSCRAAICGSCGVRINGEPGLACHTHLDHARASAQGRGDRDRADGQHARDQGPDRRHGRGALEEDPARHAVAARQAARPRARVRGGERRDGRRHPVDGLHPVRRLRVGLPGDGGRPRLHRPRRARQGLPLRRRPPRRPPARAPRRPLRRPAGDLRLHALLQVRGGLPQGRQPDGPDHAPAPHRDLRPAHRRRQQRRAPRGGAHHAGARLRAAARGRTAAALLRGQLVVREIPPRRRQRAALAAAHRRQGDRAREDRHQTGAVRPQDPAGRPAGRQADLPDRREPARAV